MKYILIFTILLISCQKQEPRIEAIMAEFKRMANDNSSIEYVETLGIDTLRLNDSRRDAIERETMVYNAMMTVVESRNNLMQVQALGDAIDASTKMEHELSILDATKQAAHIDSIRATLSDPDSNRVVEVYYFSSIRGKNAMGALVLNKYKATFNGKGELLDLSVLD